MESLPEQSRLPFEQLGAAQRVQAVLATLQSPGSQSVIFELADVNLEQLSDRDAAEVIGIFEDEEIERISHEQFGDQYWTPPTRQEEVLQSLSVDPQTVHARIADVLWRAEFGEE